MNAPVKIPNPWDNTDVEIRREGKQITLPNDPTAMPIPDAIKALERKMKDEEQVFDTFEIIDAYPQDALVAFNAALREIYGWASPVPKMTWFGPKPPQMMTVQTGPGPDDTVQVPVGAFTVPGVENEINADPHFHQGRPVLVVHGQVRKKDRDTILNIVKKTREIVAARSIYKGKPLNLRVTGDGSLDFNTPPTFIDVSKVDPSQLIMNTKTAAQIEVNVFTPLKRTKQVTEAGIPLKRGVLLSGKYGTGKTLTALTTAKIAAENGWTFIMLDKVQGLKTALEFAVRYQPAVVFAEDIDRIMSERDEDANDLVNTIDGALSKSAKVMTVLTTNHIEKIQQVMLRPGRLDAVISVEPPDAAAVEQLIRLYGREFVAKDENLDAASEALAGQIPATIREVVERAKLAMISRDATTVNGQDIIIAHQGMVDHLTLLNREEPKPSKSEVFYNAFVDMTVDAALGGGETAESIEEIRTTLHRTRDEAMKHAKTLAGAIGTAGAGISGQVKKSEEKILAKL